MLKHLFYIITFFLLLIENTNASTLNIKSKHITLKVIPEYLTLNPSSKSFDILLEITPKQNWHLYYQNPGDVGDKTELHSNDSIHFYLSTLLYSTPKKEVFEDIITSFTYSNTFYLKQTVQLKDLHSLKELNINFNLTYNACQNECIKEDVFFDLVLPVQKISTINNDYIKTFSQAERLFPKEINLTPEISKNKLILNLTQNLSKDCSSPYFISNTPKNNILSSLPQTKLITPNKLEIIFDSNEIPDTNGLILCPHHSYLTHSVSSPSPFSTSASSSSATFLLHIFFAFLAGLILNLMPCVLPILGLKALHLINTNQTKSYKQAFAYMFGVISSFMTLAGILFYAKSIGKTMGWGFQLQSIEFNLFLLFLFFLIFLSLLDKINLPQKFNNILNKLPNHSGFITGFFAVIVATPCTGPFMGTALGYALISDTINYFTIFFFLSLGYALPYTLIELNPKLFSKMLPKTGIWMLHFKHLLSIPIGLTCLWLGWIIYSQLNITSKKEEILWQPYSREKVENSLKNNEKVFINFTAKWCLVCLLNDKTTLSTQAFQNLVQQKNIKLYKGDYTNKDQEITNALKSYNRNSVPLYVYYNSKTPQILPQILRLNDLKKYFK